MNQTVILKLLKKIFPSLYFNQVFMFSNSQKKLLQKYSLYDQINKILEQKNLDLDNSDSGSFEKQKKVKLGILLKDILDKEKLRKTFENKILEKSSKKSSNSNTFSNTLNSNLEKLHKPESKVLKNNSQSQKINLDQLKITKEESINLFDDEHWIDFILPRIEHPQFTKPQIWKSCAVPSVLLGGNHLQIQKWRQFDWKE